MPKIKYISRTFSAGKLAIIDQANAIIADYEAQGFDLTLRQLYYQFVARDLIANRQEEYKRLGDIINDARLAGMIDWNRIVDRTRHLRSLGHWAEPSEIISSAMHSFRLDRWADQDYRPEVWIEKDALVGVIEGICQEFDVPYFSCRGYTSQSEMWAAGQRLQQHINADQLPVILHFGDHDPSGKDMTRDIIDRLELFMGGVKLRRLALNMDQVVAYEPPPNPAKITDSRAAAYIKEFGNESWELDALEPRVLADLIRGEIKRLIDGEKWDAVNLAESKGKSLLRKASKRWDEVAKFLQS